MIRYWIFLGLVFLATSLARAQHCAALYESYLSRINVIRDERVSIDFDLAYSKTGGRYKDAYQAYLLVYKHSDAAQIAKMTPQQAIAQKLASVVNTQVIKKAEGKSYPIRWRLEVEAFVQRMLEEDRISFKRTREWGGGQFLDQLRVAVFIPYLADEEYSTLPGLPEDKHECNYTRASALLYEPVPQIFTVRFRRDRENDRFYINLNAPRPKSYAEASPSE